MKNVVATINLFWGCSRGRIVGSMDRMNDIYSGVSPCFALQNCLRLLGQHIVFLYLHTFS